MLKIKAELDTQRLPLALNPGMVARVFFEEIEHAMRFILRQGKEWALVNSPVGATGGFKGSLIADFAGRGPILYSAEVRWDAPYAETVARGGPPRKVPMARLIPWTAAVLGHPEDAVFVQAAIAKRGTPHPGWYNARGHNIDNRLFDFIDPIALTVLMGAADKIGMRLSQ